MTFANYSKTQDFGFIRANTGNAVSGERDTSESYLRDDGEWLLGVKKSSSGIVRGLVMVFRVPWKC